MVKRWSPKVDQATMVDALKAFFTGATLAFITEQIKLSGRKRQGMRWTEEMKAVALTLYHQSPKCYKLLRSLFHLPTVLTLHRTVQNLCIKPDFHDIIFRALKSMAPSMSVKCRVCVILFNEMSIKESVRYNEAEDNIEGLEDTGVGQSKYVGNQAGVFFVRGLVEKWKQPLGYFLTSGPMNCQRLKSLLIECIHRVLAVGLIPMVFLCDQGSNNQSMLASMGVTLEKPFLLSLDIRFLPCLTHPI